MRDGEIDDILKKAAEAHRAPDPALLDRIAGSLRPDMRSVRPLPPGWAITSALGVMAVAVAFAVAARLGFHGVHAMSGLQHYAVFPCLAVLIVSAALAWTAEMIPGSRRRASPGVLLAGATAVLIAMFALLFREETSGPFVSPGIACLKAGLLTALPAALAGWCLVRRGFAVNPTGAAVAAGILAGLAGVAMLALHCPNFQTWHVLVWHAAVVPLSAVLAALAVKLAEVRRARSHST